MANRIVTLLMLLLDPERSSHDFNVFGAYYLDNGWRHGLVYDAAALKNRILSIKWSRVQ